jgi:hypothetical protein
VSKVPVVNVNDAIRSAAGRKPPAPSPASDDNTPRRISTDAGAGGREARPAVTFSDVIRAAWYGVDASDVARDRRAG